MSMNGKESGRRDGTWRAFCREDRPLGLGGRKPVCSLKEHRKTGERAYYGTFYIHTATALEQHNGEYKHAFFSLVATQKDVTYVLPRV